MKKMHFNKPGFVEKVGALVVKCGGGCADPPGMAHFLEHKMFADAATPMFEAFGALGAEVNAYTHFTHTAYYFKTLDRFDECLALLFRLVGETHFTDENVEKERGIILSEIEMYDDDPMWRLFDGLNRAFFGENGDRYVILGTRSSVEGINRQNLSECYRQFYTSNNTALITAGEVEPAQLPDLPNREAAPKRTSRPESPHVASAFWRVNMPVARPLFRMGWKIVFPDGEGSAAENIVALGLLADLLAGESAAVTTQMFAEGLIDESFYVEYSGDDDTGALVCGGAGPNPQVVASRIQDAVADAQTNGWCAERFERIRGKHVGQYLRGMNGLENLVFAQAELFARKTDLTVDDMLHAHRTVRPETVTAALSYLRPEGFAMAEVLPLQ